jgi:NifU-like protein involved in Fe-S cluster formation
MTATCRAACCVPAKLTPSELFERGFRRSREAPRAIQGKLCADTEGHTASFSLDVADGKIATMSFHVSPCATLIAYCELIAEMLPEFGLDLAQALTPHDLIAQLPGVPVLKQNRAALAIAALRSALAAASNSSPYVSGENHESRIHLRHLAP